MTDHDPKDRRDSLPVAAELSTHAGTAPEQTTAEQGPPPADFATRPASGVPQPTGEALHAEEVQRLVGEDVEGAVDGNRELQQQAGLDPDAGQN